MSLAISQPLQGSSTGRRTRPSGGARAVIRKSPEARRGELRSRQARTRRGRCARGRAGEGRDRADQRWVPSVLKPSSAGASPGETKRKLLERRFLQDAERDSRNYVVHEARRGAGATNGDTTAMAVKRQTMRGRLHSPQRPALLVRGHPRQERFLHPALDVSSVCGLRRAQAAVTAVQALRVAEVATIGRALADAPRRACRSASPRLRAGWRGISVRAVTVPRRSRAICTGGGSTDLRLNHPGEGLRHCSRGPTGGLTMPRRGSVVRFGEVDPSGGNESSPAPGA